MSLLEKQRAGGRSIWALPLDRSVLANSSVELASRRWQQIVLYGAPPHVSPFVARLGLIRQVIQRTLQY